MVIYLPTNSISSTRGCPSPEDNSSNNNINNSSSSSLGDSHPTAPSSHHKHHVYLQKKAYSKTRRESKYYRWFIFFYPLTVLGNNVQNIFCVDFILDKNLVVIKKIYPVFIYFRGFTNLGIKPLRQRKQTASEILSETLTSLASSLQSSITGKQGQ